MVWAVFAYGVGRSAHTSGFAAVYVCALMLGNAKLPHRGATRSFVEGVGWIAQIGLFVMLGLLSSPSRLTWNVVLVAVVAGLFLTFVARPLSVFASVGRVPGAGPGAGVPVLGRSARRGADRPGHRPAVGGVPSATFLFDVVLVFVIVFTCLQAPTLPFVGRRLGLIDDETRPRGRGRGRAAGQDLRRPAAGPDPARDPG